MDGKMNIIEIANLSFSYSQAAVLEDLSFGVDDGSFLAVAGPNGSGKTSLLKILCGQLKPSSGDVTIAGAAISSYTSSGLAGKVAVVPQEFIPAFEFSVFETVMMARTIHFGTLGFESKKDTDIVVETLKSTNTFELADRSLSQISGGERQRVFIARALAQDTPIILLDEPTSFLDLGHQVAIYDLLKKMQSERHKTIISVTHDINLAAQYCDQVLLLSSDRRSLMGRPENILSAANLEKIFAVDGFTGRLGKQNFFLPLGKLAKDKPGKLP